MFNRTRTSILIATFSAGLGVVHGQTNTIRQYTVTCGGYLSPDGKAPAVPAKALGIALLNNGVSGSIAFSGDISIGGQVGSETAQGTFSFGVADAGSVTLTRTINGAAAPTLNFMLLGSPGNGFSLNTIYAIGVDAGNIYSCTLNLVQVLSVAANLALPTPTEITGVPSHPIVLPSSQN